MTGISPALAGPSRPAFVMDTLESRLFLDASSPDPAAFSINTAMIVMSATESSDGTIVGKTYDSHGNFLGLLSANSFLYNVVWKSNGNGSTANFVLRPIFPMAPEPPVVEPEAEPEPQPQAPTTVTVSATPQEPAPSERSKAAGSQQPLTKTVLSEGSSSQPARTNTNRGPTLVATAAVLYETPIRAARMVIDQVFSGVPVAGTASHSAATPVVRIPDTITDGAADIAPVKQIMKVAKRTFHIAEFGSPFRLLADSIAGFADECASLPSIVAKSSPRSAWTVTAAVVAADLILGAYACHRAWQRRQLQTARVYHALAARW